MHVSRVLPWRRCLLLFAPILCVGCGAPGSGGTSVANQSALSKATTDATDPNGTDPNVASTESTIADEQAALDQIRNQPAGFRQSAIVSPATKPGDTLKSFVVAPDGNIIALVQQGDANTDSGSIAATIASYFGKPKRDEMTSKAPDRPTCEVRTFSPDGKQIAAWPLGFEGQSMALGSDQCLYIAGAGRVARYSHEGKELAAGDSPQAALIEKDRDALREAALAQIEENKENMKQMVASLKESRDAIAAEIEKTPDPEKSEQLETLDTQMQLFKQQELSVDAVEQQITERVKRINAIAVSDQNVFITCGQTKGYGYAVWRTDLNFANPECIITGLSGCCGQMDVCCENGNLWVAENARHRVVRYSPAGERLSEFGKRDREGIGEKFGGCCNPMNLCFDRSGDLLVSESNGQVKHFTADGKFVELTGVARVEPGCKNSAVKMSPDGQRIYYIDVNKSQILVLARGEQASTAGN